MSGKGYLTLSKRKLTAQDIILIQKQLEAAQLLNQLLGEAVAEIGDAVSDIEPALVNDVKAGKALGKVKGSINKLEREVEELNRRLQ